MLGTAFLAVVGTGAFNAAIDPLGVFSSPRVEGLNHIKPYLDHHRELARYLRARRLCPNTGIFGNSRAEIGFDPASPSLLDQGLSAFNHAIPGTSATTAYKQVLWLRAANCLPENIILGVEFFDFLGGAPMRPLPTLKTDPLPQLDSRFFSESVFSLTGLRDSLSTLLLQWSRNPASITDRGFNPLFNYISEVEQNGQYVLFRQRAEENARNWANKALRLEPAEGGTSDDEAAVNAILDTVTRAGSKTYIIVYPYHAQIRLMIERLGMGSLFADWKRLIVANAERYSQGRGNVEIWDFSGISQETLEGIPAKGDRRTHLNYYWEAGHFKKELGDVVIARLLRKEGNFGVRLTGENIENWLREDRSRVQSLLASQSPLLGEVDDVLRQALRK